MKLSIGIVGLPNVGKSTLFNALLKRQIADASNYPFCTIEPNIGVVEVPDPRLPVLAKIVSTSNIVPAIVEFYDIAGLVKGASIGEGLGNKFLAHIREVSALVHVVRHFIDPNITHVHNEIHPQNDIAIIETELILADLQTLSKQKEPKGLITKEDKIKWDIIKKLREHLDQNKPARNLTLSEKELSFVKTLNLLTIKPVLYVANVSENQLAELTTQKSDRFNNTIYISAKIESELAALSPNDQKAYLESLGIKESGLDRLIKKAYETLGLISFLTAGEKEVRAWTIEKGTLAPQAAGVIHTDFEKGFIRADVISFEDFTLYNGWLPAREKGKVRSEGKEYIIQDGDVIEFRVSS
jgi:hypothetical protein